MKLNSTKLCNNANKTTQLNSETTTAKINSTFKASNLPNSTKLRNYLTHRNLTNIHLTTMRIRSEEIFHLPDNLRGGHESGGMGGMADQDIRRHIVLSDIYLAINRHDLERQSMFQVGLLGILVDRKRRGGGPVSARGRAGATTTATSITRTTSGRGRLRT